MSQLLLFPDPRPLVERLGTAFFRALPESPGVYLMRDASGAVLYVGKAVNLRRRLGCYRVANPDRMPRRHLRLLRAVERIDFEECEDEQAALAVEARLLRSLRPKYNRAGTWRGLPSFLAWRVNPSELELAVMNEITPKWRAIGMLQGAWRMQNALARLIWRVAHPGEGFSQLPNGWCDARAKGNRRIQCGERLQKAIGFLEIFLTRDLLEAAAQIHAGNSFGAFETATIAEDLEMAAYGLANLRPARNDSPSF